MLTLKRRGHILDSGATPDSSTINILSQRARWVVRVSDADTEWFESTSVFLMGLNRIDRCESESGVNRMIAYRSIKLNANDNFAPVAIAA